MKERKIRNLPRVLRINKVEGETISVTFNNGAHRTIDVPALCKATGISASIARRLSDPKQLPKVQVTDGSLSFPYVVQKIKFGQKYMEVSFDIGADTLYEFSTPSPESATVDIGSLILGARKRARISQKELAKRSGTSRTYISRIENNHAALEVRTLQKVVETGLGKKLKIQIQ